MIKVNYEQVPEMKIQMSMEDDIGGNSQRTEITLVAEAQPFEIDGEERKEIKFTVVGTRELSELINGLQECRDACYEIDSLQRNCAK